jgi:vacuolar-type H+-ATPase subunit D/Vma8
MPDPNVRDLLLRKVDEIMARMAELLGEVRRVTEQLAPERARSCRNANTMCAVMVDEIRLRAHARPLDEPDDDAFLDAAIG